MATRREPGQELYLPEIGTLVFDNAERRTGVYQGLTEGLAYLRPVGGGIEWSTEMRELAPVPTDGEA